MFQMVNASASDRAGSRRLTLRYRLKTRSRPRRQYRDFPSLPKAAQAQGRSGRSTYSLKFAISSVFPPKQFAQVETGTAPENRRTYRQQGRGSLQSRPVRPPRRQCRRNTRRRLQHRSRPPLIGRGRHGETVDLQRNRRRPRQELPRRTRRTVRRRIGLLNIIHTNTAGLGP
jgi:hypothetical protein